MLARAYIPACTGYTTLADPSAAGLRPPPSRSRRRASPSRTGSASSLATPVVSGDSLRGTSAVGAPARSFALADVAKVEVQKSNAAKTAGLVVGVILLGGLVAGAVALASYQAPTCSLEGMDASTW